MDVTTTRFSGVMVHMKHKPSDRKCACCPGGIHAFCRFIMSTRDRGKDTPFLRDAIADLLVTMPEGATCEVIIKIEV